MEEQLLPIVPFGKYKGLPVTSLMSDTKYLEWCKQQEWFKKNTTIYNICVNQTITTNNQNSKTPEHNKLQNLFLEKIYVENLLRLIYKKFKYKKNVSYESAKSEFEGDFNWDIIINNLTYTKSLCNCNWDEKEDGYVCECKYENDDDYEYELSNVYIEVKPLLGDDYPCVLRKMKLQKELTLKSLEKEKQDMLDDVGYIKGKNSVFSYGSKWDEVKKTVEYINKNSKRFQGEFILLVKEYNSNTTPKDKLIEIFTQSGIKVIFINELIDNLPIETCKEQLQVNKSIQPDILKLTDNCKILEDDKMLEYHKKKYKILENNLIQAQQELLQAELKIKELEEEILLLKK